MSNDILKVGDYVTFKEGFEHLKKYFKHGPLKVLRIEDNTLTYTGGKFVFVEYAGAENGFYINALKKL